VPSEEQVGPDLDMVTAKGYPVEEYRGSNAMTMTIEQSAAA
jgi:hypothetical protein